MASGPGPSVAGTGASGVVSVVCGMATVGRVIGTLGARLCVDTTPWDLGTYEGGKVDRPQEQTKGRLFVVLVHEPAVQRLVRRRRRGQRLRRRRVGELVIRVAVENDGYGTGGVDRSIRGGKIGWGRVHRVSGVLHGAGGGQGKVVRKKLQVLDVSRVGSRGGQW